MPTEESTTQPSAFAFLKILITMTANDTTEPPPPGHVRLIASDCRGPGGESTPACDSRAWLLRDDHPLFRESALIGPAVAHRLGPQRTIRVLVNSPGGVRQRSADPDSLDDLAATDCVDYLIESAEREAIPNSVSPPEAGTVRFHFRLYVLAHIFAMPRYMRAIARLMLTAVRATAPHDPFDNDPFVDPLPVATAEIAYVCAALPPHDRFRVELTYVLAQCCVSSVRSADALAAALETVPDFAFDALVVLGALAGVEEGSANELKDVMLQCRHSVTFARDRVEERSWRARVSGLTRMVESEVRYVVERARWLLTYSPHENAEWI